MSPLNLPPAPRPLENKPYKSSGENFVEIKLDAQMTDTRMIFHATGDQTNGSCLITEIIWRKPDVSLHHIHTLEDEGFYVIEGSMTIHTDEGDIEVGPGEMAWGPRHHPHGYTIGPEGARVLLIQTPGTQLSSFFATGAGLEMTPDDLPEFNEWAEDQYGVKFFDPATRPPGSVVARTEA